MVASWPNHETNTRDAIPRPPTNTEPLINDPTAPSAQRTHAQCFNDAHCVHHTVASHAINGSPPHDKQKPTSSTTKSYNLLPALSENAPNIQSFPLTEHESFNLQANGTHTTMSPRPREHNLSNTAYTQHHLRNTSSTSTPHHAQSSPTNIHIINTTRDAEHLQHHTSSTIRARPSLNASPPPYTGHQSDLTQPSQAAALFNSAPTKTLSTANNNTNEQSTAAALIHTGPNGPPQAYDPKPIPQGPIEFVVDSGSTFHTHHRLQDLHNLRPCSQTFTGSNGKPTQCDTIGDLHCYLQRSDGVPIVATIHDVYCVPNHHYSLLSVRQLEQRGTSVRFGSKPCLQLPDGTQLPYHWKHTVYILPAIPVTPSATSTTTALVNTPAMDPTYHAWQSTNHMKHLSSQETARLWHSRLHASSERIQAAMQPGVSRGLPTNLKDAHLTPCESCQLATARQLPHNRPRDQAATRPGERIFADIAGPFKTAIGGFVHFLLCIDDYSRYIWVYPLRAKSEASNHTARLFSEFRRTANANRPASAPELTIESVHSDNGGELISARFFELCDESTVQRDFAPAYVHQLNGVAERAIGTICQSIRTLLLASGADVKYWAYALDAAVDRHNNLPPQPSKMDKLHATLPPLTRISGRIPNLLSILPFGCAAIAIISHDNIKKSDHSPRGLSAIHLGRSHDTPDAFHVLLRDAGRIATTTDVLFNETIFPWSTNAPRPETPCALLLFGGPHDGELPTILRSRNIPVKCVDNNTHNAGGWQEDILHDAFFNELMDQIRKRTYSAIHAAPPCSTCSVARFYETTSGQPGPPPVRNKEHPDGLPRDQLPPEHVYELENNNEILRRTCLLLTAAHEAGTHISIENPADRSDRNSPLFMHAQHGSFWHTSWYKALAQHAQLQEVTFAMCALGSPYQKYTTISYSGTLHPILGPLVSQSCSHPPGTHRLKAGDREANGTWASAPAASYPRGLNLILADALSTPRKPNESAEAPATSVIANTALPPPPLPSGPRVDGDEFMHRSRTTAANPHPPEDDYDNPIPPKNRCRTPGCRLRLGHIGNCTGRDPTIHLNQALQNIHVDDALALANVSKPYLADITREHVRAASAPTTAFTLILQADGSPEPIPTPKSRQKAEEIDPKNWCPAIQKELTACTRNDTWSQILASDVPPDRRPLHMLWVFKVKRNGTFKARLCVQGSRQIPGIDFDQNWAGTLRASSLRMLTALAARERMSISRWDLTNAYLQGQLESDEHLYTWPAPGEPTTDAQGRRIAWKLNKPLYGLVQAGRRFQRDLFGWLQTQGFERSHSDPCVFISRSNTPSETIIIGCYVDDIMILHHEHSSSFTSFRDNFFTKWDAEDEGNMTDLLNVQIQRNDDGSITLHQSPYIDKMIERFFPDGPPTSLQATQTPSTPELAQSVLDASLSTPDITPDKKQLELNKRYSSLVGSLLYAATQTRPDVAYAVGMLSRVLSKPNESLIKHAERVLLYLWRHKNIGLRYETTPTTPEGFSDASWEVRHSTSGWLVRWQQAVISFASKKQNSVATSSAEAELVALSDAAKDCIYFQKFSDELCPPAPRPMTLACDNQAARDLAYNPEHHDRTKHIARRHFYVRETVENHDLRVPFVRSHENLADFFTKHLPNKTFFALRKVIMNIPSER